MSRRNDYLVRLAAVALGVSLAAGLLSGCGRRGPLDQPGPIFGGTRTPVVGQQATLPQSGGAGTPAAGGQAKTDDDQNDGPPTTRDIRDPAQVLTPAAQAPIPGAPDPIGPPISPRSPY